MTVHVHVDHLVVPDPDFDVAALVEAVRQQVRTAAASGELSTGSDHHVGSLRVPVGRTDDARAVGRAVGTALGGRP